MKRPEHPQPQFERENWQNLNGQWQFETDNFLSGRARGLIEAKSLNNEITLPFCPESALSGIGNTDLARSGGGQNLSAYRRVRL